MSEPSVPRGLSRGGLAAGLVLALLCVPGVLAEKGSEKAPAPADQILRQTSAEQIKDILAKEGWAVRVDEDGDVEWKIDGIRAYILIDTSRTAIQFHVAFKDGNATLKKVNEWNKNRRFSRDYLDDSGDPHLELDLDFEGGITPARVVDFATTCAVSFRAWTTEVVR